MKVFAEGFNVLEWLDDAASIPPGKIKVPTVPLNPDQSAADCSFVVYHAAHPETYVALCGIAMALVSLGIGKLSFKLVWELYRLKTKRQKGRTSLRNTYASRYARLIRLTRPELKDVFTISKMRSKQ